MPLALLESQHHSEREDDCPGKELKEGMNEDAVPPRLGGVDVGCGRMVLMARIEVVHVASSLFLVCLGEERAGWRISSGEFNEWRASRIVASSEPYAASARSTVHLLTKQAIGAEMEG